MSGRLPRTIAAIAVTVLFVALIASVLHQAERNLALPLTDRA